MLLPDQVVASLFLYEWWHCWWVCCCMLCEPILCVHAPGIALVYLHSLVAVELALRDGN